MEAVINLFDDTEAFYDYSVGRVMKFSALRRIEQEGREPSSWGYLTPEQIRELGGHPMSAEERAKWAAGITPRGEG